MPYNTRVVKRFMTIKVTACARNERLLLLFNIYELFALPSFHLYTPSAPPQKITRNICLKRNKHNTKSHTLLIAHKKAREIVQYSIAFPEVIAVFCNVQFTTTSRGYIFLRLIEITSCISLNVVLPNIVLSGE